MVYYEKDVKKALKKGNIPRKQLELFHHVFQSLDLTNDMNMFDIKKLKGSAKRDYYRVRKGKYRAIFYIDNNDYYVVSIGKREEVYNSWE